MLVLSDVISSFPYSLTKLIELFFGAAPSAHSKLAASQTNLNQIRA